MSILSSFVLAYVASVGSSGGGLVHDSFLRDDVKPDDFRRLTENARRGRTHWACYGSGFFITKDGYILTNHHVIENAREVVVVWRKTAYLADVAAKNAEHDLGLLKINLFPRATNGTYVVNGIPTVPALALTDDCKVGQTIYVVGYPQASILGYDPKMTRGMVGGLSGLRGRKDRIMMDNLIEGGNSGGPVVNEQGEVLGIAVESARVNERYSYAVNMESVRKILPKNVNVTWGVPGRRIAPEKLAKKVIDSLVYVLNFKEGACERVASTATDPDDARKRENATWLKKAMLDAKWCKLKKEWKDLLEITDRILDVQGDVGEARAWNDLARDELGMHLILIAEADGRDVVARVKPICGFKEEFVECGRPVALFGGRNKRGFDVEAKLTYEDGEWEWAGELKCVYDWRGTKEKRIVLKHVGKKCKE